MKYEIVKHETKGYFYLWDNEAGAQVCDPDGEPLRFDEMNDKTGNVYCINCKPYYDPDFE